MIGLGLLATAGGGVGGIWLALIGFFVVFAAKAEEGGLRIRTAFAGREAGRFMSFPAVTVPAGISVTEAVEDYFVRHRYAAFPVLDGDRPIGLIDMGTVEHVPSALRPTTTAGQVAIDDRDLLVDEHQDIAELLERPAFQRVGRAIVFARGHAGVGILSITDVNRALRAFDLESGPRGAPLSPRRS